MQCFPLAAHTPCTVPTRLPLPCPVLPTISPPLLGVPSLSVFLPPYSPPPPLQVSLGIRKDGLHLTN